jgi:hypothetical protein
MCALKKEKEKKEKTDINHIYIYICVCIYGRDLSPRPFCFVCVFMYIISFTCCIFSCVTVQKYI